MKPVNKILFTLGMLWALPVTLFAFVVAVLLRPTGTRWAVLRYGNMPGRGGVGRLVGTDFVSSAFGCGLGRDFGACGLAQSTLGCASHRRA